MSGIEGVGSPTAATAGNTAVSRNRQSLGQDDFLRLMTKQLTTQDPFNPVDNTQMVAQMAQFSQVSGIEQMNDKLATLIDMIGGTGAYAPPPATDPTTPPANPMTGA
jgi:flagellar basal-body rod modification protein FlgD